LPIAVLIFVSSDRSTTAFLAIASWSRAQRAPSALQILGFPPLFVVFCADDPRLRSATHPLFPVLVTARPKRLGRWTPFVHDVKNI
jgi:hypothetical protein